MKKKILAQVSSVTGNTRKVADFTMNMLRKEGHEVIEIMSASEIDSIKVSQFDFVIVFFWCRKSAMDDKSNKLVDALTGVPILAIGTLGGHDDGPYAERVRGNVREKIKEKNSCLDIFMCRGKVNLKRTWERAKLPESAPHHLDEKGIRRHLESQSHPDSRDLLAASKFAMKAANEFVR